MSALADRLRAMVQAGRNVPGGGIGRVALPIGDVAAVLDEHERLEHLYAEKVRADLETANAAEDHRSALRAARRRARDAESRLERERALAADMRARAEAAEKAAEHPTDRHTLEADLAAAADSLLTLQRAVTILHDWQQRQFPEGSRTPIGEALNPDGTPRLGAILAGRAQVLFALALLHGPPEDHSCC